MITLWLLCDYIPLILFCFIKNIIENILYKVLIKILCEYLENHPQADYLKNNWILLPQICAYWACSSIFWNVFYSINALLKLLSEHCGNISHNYTANDFQYVSTCKIFMRFHDVDTVTDVTKTLLKRFRQWYKKYFWMVSLNFRKICFQNFRNIFLHFQFHKKIFP